MVVLQYRTIVIQSSKIGTRRNKKWIVDSRVLQVVAKCRHDQGEILYISQGLVCLAGERHAVNSLGNIEGMKPVVIRIVEHARTNTEDEFLQFLLGNINFLREFLFKENLQGKV